MFALKVKLANAFVLVYDNFGGNSDSSTNNPFIPEIWANESLAILEENMVAAQLIHRDFEPEFARYGDIVHTRRPGEFVANRKVPSDDVLPQDVTALDVQVPLNQHIYVSFLIRDGEESKSFKDLVEVYLAPAMLAQARIIDRIVLGQYPQFLANAYGNLNGLTPTNARGNILGMRNIMNRNKAYMDGRNFILSPFSETTLLNLDLFTQAQQVGDGGVALQEAWLGRKFGFNMYMCQNMSHVNVGSDNQTATVNHSGGYPVGTKTLVTTAFSTTPGTGTWVTIAGDDSPQQVQAGTTTTSLLILPGLRFAVSNGAAVVNYTAGAINQSSGSGGYPANWSKPIVYDVFVADPFVGQFLSFGSETLTYVITEVDTVNKTILLDRPLVNAVTDDEAINLGPPGDYNLAFHRNAIALVVRPLAMPRQGTGALSAVVNHNDLSMRATITYNGTKQGHLVTLDMLCGIAILDTNLAAVMLG